eukprot:SM000258S09099  [mRNA]  locus=s258:40817:44791:+ [translate_table: standard]
MAPWGLLAGAAACILFPQHKGAILALGAVATVLRGDGAGGGQASGGNGGGGRGDDELFVGTDGEATRPARRVVLEWHGVDCQLLDKHGKEAKRILRNVSGGAQPGRLLAIMGPSGSGKTTLLNTLAGQLPRSGKMRLRGRLLIDGVPVQQARLRQAYVRQEDIFYSQLTVRETLVMAAKLQLPKSMPEAFKDSYVDSLLQRLGLVRRQPDLLSELLPVLLHCSELMALRSTQVGAADTIVGDNKVRGISGGEKKRLSIACELIASPSVIFADEPTTGLDAFQAEKVMETLRQLAKDGHTVVASIHQPRGSIYTMFDDLLLLADGLVIYSGHADEALSYFGELGHTCPLHSNPAEFLSDLISIDFSSAETEAQTRDRVTELAAKFGKKQRQQPMPQPDEEGEKQGEEERLGAFINARRGGWFTQFRLLFRRAWRQTIRDKPTNFVRGTMNVTSAIIFGSIFWRMGLGQTAIQDRMGLLQVAAINTAMASLTKTVNVFPRERVIVDRERSKGSYGVGPYFVSKLMAELPIGAAFPLLFGAIVYPLTGLHKSAKRFLQFCGLVTIESFTSSALGLTVGSLVPSTEAALALGPSIMTVFIVFGGYYVNAENTPSFFRWIPSVSLIRWAFEGLCVNEFRGLKFDARQPTDAKTGEQVLERLSFGNSSIEHAVRKEVQILLFWYLATFYLLKAKRPKFQPLEEPSQEEPVVSPLPDTTEVSENDI